MSSKVKKQETTQRQMYDVFKQAWQTPGGRVALAQALKDSIRAESQLEEIKEIIDLGMDIGGISGLIFLFEWVKDKSEKESDYDYMIQRLNLERQIEILDKKYEGK